MFLNSTVWNSKYALWYGQFLHGSRFYLFYAYGESQYYSSANIELNAVTNTANICLILLKSGTTCVNCIFFCKILTENYTLQCYFYVRTILAAMAMQQCTIILRVNIMHLNGRYWGCMALGEISQTACPWVEILISVPNVINTTMRRLKHFDYRVLLTPMHMVGNLAHSFWKGQNPYPMPYLPFPGQKYWKMHDARKY